MRAIRLLLLLFAVVGAVALALLRPLPGRATRGFGSSATTGTAADPMPPLSRTLRRTKRRLSAHQPALTFGSRVVDYARRFLGVPYAYGGTSPRSGFDCSGLVRYVYSHFGISLPHSSFADLMRGRHVSRWHLRPGDLVFFYDAGHVGIYVGRQRFIDAPHTGTVVRISTLSAYGGAYYGARRIEP